MYLTRLLVPIICTVFLLLSVNYAIGAGDGAGQQTPAAAAQVAADRIDLNSADARSLTTLPGIGPKIAEKIDAYRQANGPFQSVDDLLGVKGIGPKMLEKIRPLVTVS